MSNIIKSFEDAFARSKAKNWDKVYILIDLHGTIFKPCYLDEEKFEYYPYAKKTLQLMTDLVIDGTTIIPILWTSSDIWSLGPYIKKFTEDKIRFEYINRNPEVKPLPTDPKSLCLDEKFYFNVGLDDKFGFDAEHDWVDIYKFLYNKKND